jgi:hypothetical protein
MGEDSDLKAVFYAVNGLSGEMKPLGKAQLGLTDEERKVMSEKAVDIYEGERAKGPSNIFDRLKQGVLFGKAMVRFVTADYYVNRLG